MRVTPVQPPSEDKRWRIVSATMSRHGYSTDSLIETLHSTQEAFGYLDDIAMHYIAQSLKAPLSRVYGVATFYNLFMLKPQGEHTCVVCMGTACYIKGGPQIMAALELHSGIRKGQTTEDKQLSLLAARCLGACGLAPACVFDGEMVGKLAPEDAVTRVKEWSDHAS